MKNNKNISKQTKKDSFMFLCLFEITYLFIIEALLIIGGVCLYILVPAPLPLIVPLLIMFVIGAVLFAMFLCLRCIEYRKNYCKQEVAV